MRALAILLLSMLIASHTPVVGQSINEFRIGVLGGENAQDRLRSIECLRTYTEEVLEAPVKLYATADYNGIVDGLLGGNIDLALISTSAYANLYARGKDIVRPIVTQVGVDGSIGYHSVGIARYGTGIDSIEDLNGKVVGFSSPNSTSGYIIPSRELQELYGISINPGEYFRDVVFTGSHEDTVNALALGEIDAGWIWSNSDGTRSDGSGMSALRQAQNAGLVEMDQFVEISSSRLIPNPPVVLRNDLPEDIRYLMADLLENLYDKDKNCMFSVVGSETIGFRRTDQSDYYSVIAAFCPNCTNAPETCSKSACAQGYCCKEGKCEKC